eukprot:scaffold79514_cov29-Tisochrysis_lutea.AAC.2
MASGPGHQWTVRSRRKKKARFSDRGAPSSAQSSTLGDPSTAWRGLGITEKRTALCVCHRGASPGPRVRWTRGVKPAVRSTSRLSAPLSVATCSTSSVLTGNGIPRSAVASLLSAAVLT